MFDPPVIDSYGGRSLHEQSHGESFLTLLTQRFGGKGIMVYPDACIFQCGTDGISRVACEDTEHFQVTRDFLADPARTLRVVLAR